MIVALVDVAFGWGPLVHAGMTSFAVYRTNTAACLGSKAPGDPCFAMLASTDLPDALAFGKFNMSGDSNYLCSDLSYLHSPAFGAFMLSSALANNATLGFDAIGFAQGFLGHTLGDIVGFWSRSGPTLQGMLCGNHVGPCDQNIRYINLWHYMTDLDALVCDMLRWDPLGVPTVASLPRAALQFVADQSVAFSKITPSFAPTTVPAIEACVRFWDPEQRLDNEMARRKAHTTNEQQAVLVDDLGFFSKVQGSKNLSLFMLAQVECAADVISAAITDVQNGLSGATVMANAIANTGQLYAKHFCTV